MIGTYRARQNIVKGLNLFISPFLPHAIIKSAGVWVFLLFAFSVSRYPYPLSDWLFCSPQAGMLTEGQKGLGGGHVAWLILTALQHHSPKLNFLEGCRILLAAPWRAASQCLSGRPAGHHILQTPASFVLLENVAHWFSKKRYRKSCVTESLGIPLHLALSVVLC